MDRGKIGIMKGSNIQMATQVAIVTHSQGPWTVVKKPRHQRKGKEREFQFTGNHVEKGGQGGSHAASRSRFVSLHEDEGDHAVVMEGDHEVEVRGKEYEKKPSESPSIRAEKEQLGVEEMEVVMETAPGLGLLKEDGRWDSDFIRMLMPEVIAQRIFAIMPPSAQADSDKRLWPVDRMRDFSL
ncbi:hypothetical protein JHK82_037937 [Glycine max]|nr:hypothetical protein JHK82_037937 [Glycine max]